MVYTRVSTAEQGKSGLGLEGQKRDIAIFLERFSEEPYEIIADVPTLIHWHGQIPPNEQDGVPDLPQPMLQPDETRSYDYEPLPGT
ncbi:multicopper oxidase domain-containing protein [Paracoccus mutanolyticus]|uniref:multicopper oxidase domain-containing protein n=1 Tax=Paracoccus mutanolyticus TaxID=1499308 RepID=UPI00294FEFC9|nr:multicopper oxidase domain-containing protein [Paracoccus mutanolyticus]